MSDVIPTQPADQGEPDYSAKNTLFYNPIFPIMTVMVNLEMPIEEMASEIAKMSSDTKNYDGGFTTYFNRQNLDHVPGIAQLKEAIFGITTAYARELKLEMNEEKFSVHMWANYMRKDGYHPPHIHPRSQISGTFYVKCNEKSSPIVLCNPTEALRMHDLQPGRVGDFTPFTSPSVSIQPKENQLLLWPSWLYHYVPTHMDSSPRISISFNVDTLPPGV